MTFEREPAHKHVLTETIDLGLELAFEFSLPDRQMLHLPKGGGVESHDTWLLDTTHDRGLDKLPE